MPTDLSSPPLFLAGTATAVHLLSVYQPLLLIAFTLPYAWLISTVIDKDLRYFHLNVPAWTSTCLAGLVAGLCAALVTPLFWVGFPLMIVIYLAVPYAYWKYRNPKVPAKFRFDLFAGKWAKMIAARKTQKAFGEVTVSYADGKGNRLTPPGKESPLFEVHLATEQLLVPALPARASRVELTPGTSGYVNVQYVDSMRYRRGNLTAELAVKVIDYLKTAAGLETKDRRKRLSAPIKMEVAGSKINLVLTTWGSSAGQVLRIDFEREKQLTVAPDKLGLLPAQLLLLADAVKDVRSGVVVVATAPGQGLTTLAYSLISRHDPYNSNIKTLERFVERRLEGIDHNVWDSADPNIDYATALQSIVRRGPDIVLASDLGEPGVGKVLVNPNNAGTLFYVLTPSESVEAALTAYFKAVGDSKIASAKIIAVVTQRQVRTLCSECRQPYQASPEQSKRLGGAAGKTLQLFRSSGKIQEKNQVIDCPACQGTGFIGVTGLLEVVRADERSREFLAGGDVANGTQQMRRAFRSPLAQEVALMKVRGGETSLEEIARIFAPPKTAATTKPAAAASPATRPVSKEPPPRKTT